MRVVIDISKDTYEIAKQGSWKWPADDVYNAIKNGKVLPEGRDELLMRFINEYGAQPQIDMCIEEMSELTKALLKWRRASGKYLTVERDNIIAELADVRIMCRQMELLFQAEDEVERCIDFKVDRQKQRLERRRDDGKRCD